MWNTFVWLTSHGPGSAVEFVGQDGARKSMDVYEDAALWFATKMWAGEKDRSIRYDITVGYVHGLQNDMSKSTVTKRRFLVTVRSEPFSKAEQIGAGNEVLLNALKEMGHEEG